MKRILAAAAALLLMGLTACSVAEEPLTAKLDDAGVAEAIVEAGELGVHRADVSASDESDITVHASITLVEERFTADTICRSIRAVVDTTPFDFDYLDIYLEVAGKGDIVHINPYYESFGVAAEFSTVTYENARAIAGKCEPA